ncbi:DUF1015 domain-containing protein [Chloroflexota bacterium]
MADIRPFRGVRYNNQLVQDIATVICPPYDIITPQMEQGLYSRSEYNFVRLESNRELPQDTATENKYTRSAAILEQWLQEGILKVDEMPAIYLHDHYFTYKGGEYRRRGISVCVRLEEWDKKVVRPHEDTQAGARGDRLTLLWACQANISPILALYEDQGQQVSSVLAAQERNKPVISIGTAEEGHKVWAINEPVAIEQITSNLAHQPLYIADGHHRYESALTYQRERHTCSSSVSGAEAFNFVMMELVGFSGSGLLILPPHRLVRGVSKPTMRELRDKLESFFEIDELSLSMPDVWQQVDDLLGSKVNQVKLALFGLAAESLFVLSLRDQTVAGQMMPNFHSELYKKLDVSVVDHIILEKLLGLSLEKEEAIITYSCDKVDAINKVLNGEYQLAFILSPIKAEVIKAIADVGDRMPRKSTYFYPKSPSGLVFHYFGVA